MSRHHENQWLKTQKYLIIYSPTKFEASHIFVIFTPCRATFYPNTRPDGVTTRYAEVFCDLSFNTVYP